MARRNFAAIKIVRGGAEEQEKLKAEIQMLKHSHNPYIVQYLGYSRYSNRLYLLMTYHPGGTLFTSLRRSDRHQYKKRYELIRPESFVTLHGFLVLHTQNM